jgi:hypothetical protein
LSRSHVGSGSRPAWLQKADAPHQKGTAGRGQELHSVHGWPRPAPQSARSRVHNHAHTSRYKRDTDNHDGNADGNERGRRQHPAACHGNVADPLSQAPGVCPRLLSPWLLCACHSRATSGGQSRSTTARRSRDAPMSWAGAKAGVTWALPLRIMAALTRQMSAV